MNIKQYETIKLQIHGEKEKVMTEISTLLLEKRHVEAKKQYEIHVFQSRSKMIANSGSVTASFLSCAAFSPEKLKDLEKKIQKINEFIARNEHELEQLKEKDRTIDNLFGEYEQKRKKAAEKAEEKTLLDLKMSLSN